MRTLIPGLCSATVAVCGLVFCAESAGDRPEISRTNPTGLPSIDYLTHVTTVKNARKLLYIAGQTAVNTKYEVVGSTVSEQADEALKNLTRALAAGGSNKQQILQLNVFFVPSTPEDGKIVTAKLKGYFNGSSLPSGTFVGVPKLVGDGLLFEIEGVALVIDKGGVK